jgi:hypothetical protein
MVEICLDFLQKPAGHAGRDALTLFPRSDGFHVYAEELAENRLADPQRGADPFISSGPNLRGVRMQ